VKDTELKKLLAHVDETLWVTRLWYPIERD